MSFVKGEGLFTARPTTREEARSRYFSKGAIEQQAVQHGLDREVVASATQHIEPLLETATVFRYFPQIIERKIKEITREKQK